MKSIFFTRYNFFDLSWACMAGVLIANGHPVYAALLAIIGTVASITGEFFFPSDPKLRRRA